MTQTLIRVRFLGATNTKGARWSVSDGFSGYVGAISAREYYGRPAHITYPVQYDQNDHGRREAVTNFLHRFWGKDWEPDIEGQYASEAYYWTAKRKEKE